MGLARQILIETARRGPEAVLLAPGLRLDGLTLATIARNMGLHLIRHGLRRGGKVAVRSDDLLASLASILAAGALGCSWVVAGRPESAAADQLLDTAPDGVLLPGALLLDNDWAQAPMAEGPGMFPGLADELPWLILDGAGLTEADLEARFRAEAGVFDRPGRGVAGLGGPEEAQQLILALMTLHHGGVLVESADPAEWRAAGVVLVAGHPAAVAGCLAQGPAGLRFGDLRLWGADPGHDWPFDRVVQVPPLVAPEAIRDETPPGLPPLALLDRLIREVEGVEDAVTFMIPREGRPDRLTALLRLVPGADLPRITSDARIAALRLGGKAAVPGRFILTEVLPRRPDGTPDREACRALVLETRAARRRERAATASSGKGVD